MEVPTHEPARVGRLPAPFADGPCFRKVSVSEDDYPNDPAAAGRELSPLHGGPLSQRAQDLQREAAELPAAKAAERIGNAIVDNEVVILEGQTGSGKSTQVPQIALDLLWCRRLNHRKVVHVCPLIEPLRCLHRRLEDEMDASGQIQLATGRVSRLGKVIGSC